MTSRNSSPFYANLSILNNVNLHDTKAQRELMVAFNLYTSQSFLDTVHSDKSMVPLNAAHAQTFRRIIRSIKTVTPTYRLLLDAMTKFASAAKGSAAQVKKATMELVGLAEGKVLEHPYLHREEYMEALERWEKANGGCKCDNEEAFDSDGKKDGDDGVDGVIDGVVNGVVDDVSGKKSRLRKVGLDGETLEMHIAKIACPENVIRSHSANSNVLRNSQVCSSFIFMRYVALTAKPQNDGKLSLSQNTQKKRVRIRALKSKTIKVATGERKPRTCFSCKKNHSMCDRVMPVCGCCSRYGRNCQWEIFDYPPAPSFIAINAK
jgi:hypothetical protein